MRAQQLRRLWEELSFRPRKSMGQNYMVDDNVIRKLVDSYELSRDENVLEIGPGFGALTRHLARECRFLWGVEKDRKAAGTLSQALCDVPNAEVINRDFLELDLASYARCGRFKIVGNIPYSVSSLMIEKTLMAHESVKAAYFVMQEELVDRIMARPGGREYSRLSVLVQYYSTPAKLFGIKRNSFYPVPKVGSALLRMDIHRNPPIKAADEEFLFFLVNAAYSQRRKKAINSVSGAVYGGRSISKSLLCDVFEACDVDLSARAEELGIDQWCSLADMLGERLLVKGKLV